MALRLHTEVHTMTPEIRIPQKNSREPLSKQPPPRSSLLPTSPHQITTLTLSTKPTTNHKTLSLGTIKPLSIKTSTPKSSAPTPIPHISTPKDTPSAAHSPPQKTFLPRPTFYPASITKTRRHDLSPALSTLFHGNRISSLAR